VADGASSLLLSGRVGLYVFELWGKDRKLGAHVRRLEKAGYACYFPLAWSKRAKANPATAAKFSRSVVRISHGCFRREYNIVGWANAVCVNRRHSELVNIFEELENVSIGKPAMGGGCEINSAWQRILDRMAKSNNSESQFS